MVQLQNVDQGQSLENSYFDTKIDTPTIINDAAIIVGSLGEMKGAVKCSSIL